LKGIMRGGRGRLILILMVLLTTLNLGRMASKQTFDGPALIATTKIIVIRPGSLPSVGRQLQSQGIIRHPDLFALAAWLTRNAGPVHAGEFSIPAHSSFHQILNILRFAPVVQHQATIPEGLTGPQIAAIINELPEATGHVGAPAEGAVLPQTYDYARNTPRRAILARAEAAMTHLLAQAWAGRADNLPISTQAQALTLASIVQQETPLTAELPKIAAVYENRLKQNMKLQADPTVIFAASGGGTALAGGITRADLALNSPYNTYLHHGLPPGPICAPGALAIEAVLHPAVSDDLYFVATGQGGHVFAANFAQQLANIARFRASQTGRP
jgi:UPF0755 protein